MTQTITLQPGVDYQPTIQAAGLQAITDGRITQQHLDDLQSFSNDMTAWMAAAPPSLNFGNILQYILPILSLIFPQFAPIIAAIIQALGGLVPTPTPAPAPSPIGGFFGQLWAIIKSIFTGGTLPVPVPSPSPIPGGIVTPVPVP